MEAFTFSRTEEFLLIAAGILFIIQAIYYLCLYNRINLHNKAVKKGNIPFTDERPPISVIICTHNEAEDLRNNLISILEQDYPKFEVIVINDGNTDDSDDYLTLLEKEHPYLYHSFVPESSRYISHKKLAVTLGIKASKYEWLVFTDASCRPQSAQWLNLMARNFTPQTQIVLGYSNYATYKGWFQKVVAFDNLFTSMRYLGFALARSPYMGIGRNLAYRKALFYQHKGFSAHLNLRRGDDDLFINHAATSKNLRVETEANATMQIQPRIQSKSWREEKVGYFSTARLYHGMQRYVYGAETITRLLFYLTWIGTCTLAILNTHWLSAGIAFLIFLLRFSMQASVINHTAQELGENRRYYLTLPVFDLLQPLQSFSWKLQYSFRKKSEFLRK